VTVTDCNQCISDIVAIRPSAPVVYKSINSNSKQEVLAPITNFVNLRVDLYSRYD